ncbi:MAG: sce7726 family protein [Hymenobacter sp.]|nr:sce7726 family protein [Hymenobacter sp.]
MNDPEIRALLYPLLTGGVHIDELPTGSTRADVVHITGQFMHGYELKGDGDTLQRVRRQLACYARAYDLVTFIVTEKHLPGLLLLLPKWVGILVASPAGLHSHRPARYNAAVERAAVADLLLLEEVRQFLLARGLTGISLLRRREVLHLLRNAHAIPLSALAQYVREQLTARLPQRLEARAGRKAERQRLGTRSRKPKRKPKKHRPQPQPASRAGSA